jgi:hypothetical protein
MASFHSAEDELGQELPLQPFVDALQAASPRTSARECSRCTDRPVPCDGPGWPLRLRTLVGECGLSMVSRAVTLSTESLGRPLETLERKTLPGIVARAVLEVMTAIRVVPSLLRL